MAKERFRQSTFCSCITIISTCFLVCSVKTPTSLLTTKICLSSANIIQPSTRLYPELHIPYPSTDLTFSSKLACKLLLPWEMFTPVLLFLCFFELGASMGQAWLGSPAVACRTSDLEVAVRLPAVPLPGNNPGQVVHTHVPLSPSSIIWYQPNRWEGNGSMWERCGLPPI